MRVKTVPGLLMIAYLIPGFSVGWKTPFLWFSAKLGLTYTIILIAVMVAVVVAA